MESQLLLWSVNGLHGSQWLLMFTVEGQ
jgi:hypothetical protein